MITGILKVDGRIFILTCYIWMDEPEDLIYFIEKSGIKFDKSAWISSVWLHSDGKYREKLLYGIVKG